MRSVLAKLDSGLPVEDIKKSVTVLDACQWIAASVKEVKATTVRKCLEKTGFKEAPEEEVDNFEEKDDIPLARLVEELRQHLPDPLHC